MYVEPMTVMLVVAGVPVSTVIVCVAGVPEATVNCCVCAVCAIVIVQSAVFSVADSVMELIAVTVNGEPSEVMTDRCVVASAV